MHIHAPISFYNSLFWVRKWVQHLWPQKDSPFCQERFFYQAFNGSLIRKGISGICPSKLCLFFSSSQKMFSFFSEIFLFVFYWLNLMPTEGYVAMKQTALNLPANATHLRRAWTFIGINWFSSQKNWNVSRIRIRSLTYTKIVVLHLIWQEMQRIWVKFQLSLVSNLKVENGKGKHLRRTWTFITINWFHKVLDCFFFIPVDTRTEEFSEKFETTLAYRGQP